MIDMPGRKARLLAASVALLISMALGSGGALAQAADLVAINGKVFTADDRAPLVEAFAVKDGKFIAVGASEAVLKTAGPNSRVIDLKGRFVAPGLADGHFHNEGGGPGVDLSDTRSMAELMAAVEEAAKKAVPGDLIISNSDWHEAQLKEQRLPTAKELDRVSPNNPLVLVRGGHDYILNSAALRKYNITKDTPEPAGGAITRDADGELTGELIDNAKNFVKLPSPRSVTVDDVLTTQRRLNAYGITSVRVPGGYKGEFSQALNAILEARKSGQLTLRYTIYLPGFGVRQPERILDIIAKSPLKQDEGDEWVRIGGIKLLVDGGFEGGLMSKPFAGPYGKGGTFFGLMVVPKADFTRVVRAINDAGWRATTHAVGDAGLDQVLEAYEAANADHPLAGKRWAVEHLFVSRPEQLERMKKLDLALSVQDHLYLAAPALKNYLGAERASQVTPVKTYLDAGFLVVGGTDSPVVPFNPFWELYHFLTRDTISDGVYGANERVPSREELLRMITINYARLTGEADIKGSITPGKLADFAVLSDDLLTVAEKRIPQMKAMLTYVGGKEAYRDPTMQ
ncbi:amidohydrolase [Terrarubrum flagellatum]|uniref:amidohydrolase n=1 Tax=Terrirubrum flagellatum TaxID=2895980 RepID=UPI0031456DBA